MAALNPGARIVRRSVPADAGQWPQQVPPLLRRIYAQRGAQDLASAQPRLAQLLPPSALKGIDAAVALLAAAIADGRRILVVGDFDCDGATATALAVRGLRLLGARNVVHAVPNRIEHGYGLSVGLVAELAALEPALLVTVDHGIACVPGVTLAKELGWQVLVTDHHLPGAQLPPADAIVNPNQPGCGFPSKVLAGVGVMFYVLLALRAHLRSAGAFADGKGPDLSVLLDLVAVGTVADLVPLDANNRALVAAGLRRLRAGQCCAGLQALVQVSRRQAARLSASDIGFALGPRINAAGRLEDMALGIELLLTDDPGRAAHIAGLLEEINSERRAVQQQMTDEAEAAVARALAAAGQVPVAACLHDPDWHPGVVGLVASKMKDRLYRPVIAFAPAEPGSSTLRGSARSIAGFHIRDALAAVNAAHPGLIDKFGGHAMAAGLSLAAGRLAEFTAAFQAEAARCLAPHQLQAQLLSDGELADDELDALHARALREAGPWGQGFEEPLFDGVFTVAHWKVLKERHLKLSLRSDGGRVLDAIWFGGWQGSAPAPRVRLAYRLVEDDFRGGDAVQLLVQHLLPA